MKNHRILVVEDEAIVAMDIEDRLTALGYQLAGRAASGQQALELAAAQHPDLILMDIRLEGDRDGIVTAQEIRRRFHLPVIFLTAYSEDETLERAKLAEPLGYLLKPFEDQELKSTIEIALYKHQAEEEIRRLNRLLDVLSQVNQAVAHSRSREEVLAVVCRLLVECGEVDLAWIGWLDSATSQIKPVAHYGHHTEMLTQADFYADNRPEGQGNPGKAIRAGKPFICTTCPGEACLYPGEKQPRRFGFQACGSFPVRLGGEVCAVLNICVAEPKFFGDRETELLQEVAQDISWALDKQESEFRRDQAEAALRASEEKFRLAMEAAEEGIWDWDTPTGGLYLSPGFMRVLGYEPGEIIPNYQVWEEHVHPEDLPGVLRTLEEHLTGKTPTYEGEYRVHTKQGHYLWVLSRGRVVSHTADGTPLRMVGAVSDITERKQMEEALRESEGRVKAKLDSILSPSGDIGQLELEDIIDTQAIQTLMADFYQLTRLPMSIIDLKGKVLVGIGWQDICTQFHRRHPLTLQRCLESDLELSQGVPPGTFKLYKCKNNLWDMFTPIMVGGKHLGNLFMGQFFFEDDIPDIEFFRSQARQYGFDEAAYLAALARVPRWSRQTIDTAMSFFSKLAHMISMLCHSNIKLARSITEQENLLEVLRANEEKIRADEQFLNDIFSSIKDGLGVLDLERNIVRVNPAMQKFVRTLPIEGRKCHQVYLDSSSPCQDCPVSVTLETGEVCQKLTEVKTIDGQTMFVEIYSYPLINRTREVTGVIEYVRDVTAVKKAEATLKEMERQLLQAQKMEAIGTLAGGIAHDFNNILWAIMGYAEMASYNLLNTEMARQYLDQVLKASQRAKNLVGQILAFSRRLESKKKPIYLKNIAQEAVNLLRASLPATIEIRPRLESESPILADPTQMSQVIMNLGTNAFHAMEKTGGLLSVSLEDVQVEQPLAAVNGDLPPGAYVRLRIEDTGNGMDPAIMSRIFEPYFTTKEVGKGTGLGLATVLGIVKSHGGEICLESQTTLGTVFSVYFPIIEQRPDQPLQDQPPLPTSPGRILFIDDEPSLAELGKAALTRLGYDVQAFTNSREALATFEASPQEIDLVVTDLTMPHFTGLDLAKHFQTLRPEMPIIMCTGYTELLKPEEVRSLGIREVLTKPLGLTQLAETVKQALQADED